MTAEQARKIFDGSTKPIKEKADRINSDILTELFFSNTVMEWQNASGERAHGEYLLERMREVFTEWIGDEKKADVLDGMIADYCTYYQQVGFREGFNIALNIMVQGMRFTTLPV